MPTAIPEWGPHEPGLYRCGGVFSGVGLPYVHFHRPSYSLLQISAEVATDARFEPQGFQLLQCNECSEFEYGLYAPSLNRVLFTSHKPNLPILVEWDWAWET